MDEIKPIVEQLKALPDFERYPLPEVLYKTFGLTKPKPADSIGKFMADSAMSVYMTGMTKTEVRPPAEGGVRVLKPLILVDGTEYDPYKVVPILDEVKEAPPLPIDSTIEKTADAGHSTTHVSWSYSTGANATKIQELTDQFLSSLPSLRADLNIASYEPRHDVS